MGNSPSQAIALFLKRLCVRSRLNEEEQAVVLDWAAVGFTKDVSGDFIDFGERVHHASLVVRGLAGRYAQLADGRRQFVALHMPGDMADLHSCMLPSTSWALHALTPSTILRVPHQAILDAADRYPAIAHALWRDCVVDLGVLAQWMVNLGRKDALGRVAHLLCEMALRYCALGQGTLERYTFPITQLDLADAVGLTPVHLNRVLQRLREDRIAAKDRETVVIHEWEQLDALAEFDPAYLQLAVQEEG